MAAYLIRKEKHYFPNEWDKDKVVQFVNTDIKVCPVCDKVDIRLDHLDRHYINEKLTTKNK